MSFSDVAPAHLIFLPFLWVSVLLYIYIIVKIIRARRANSTLFLTPFFSIVLGQSFWDLCMFFVSFFLVFCRRYMLLPFPVGENGFYPKFIYFLQTVFPNCMYMSSMLYAISRASAFKWPAKHQEMWRTRNVILSNFLIAILSTINISRLFIGDHTVTLEMIAPGRMKMFQDDNLLVNDGWQDLVLSMGACIFCACLYTWSAINSRQIGLKNLRYQKKFLRCAITVFLPYIPNAIKSALLIYAGYIHDDLLTFYCIEAWLYVTYLMCLTQPWVLLVNYPKIRPRLASGEVESSMATNSRNRFQVDQHRGKVSNGVAIETTITITPVNFG